MIHRSLSIVLFIIFVTEFGQQSLLVQGRFVFGCWQRDLQGSYAAPFLVVIGRRKDLLHGQFLEFFVVDFVLVDPPKGQIVEQTNGIDGNFRLFRFRGGQIGLEEVP